jgi:hypothetical protein
MYKQRTKKDVYNESPLDLRTYINGEIAIKPYYYYRCGSLHVRYTVDRCINLSPSEATQLKLELTASSQDKQSILGKAWNLFVEVIKKPVIQDGIAEVERRLKSGQQNKSCSIQ